MTKLLYFLSCKDSVMLFKFSLVLCSSLGVLPSNLTVQIRLIILASILSSLITCLHAKFRFLITEHDIYILCLLVLIENLNWLTKQLHLRLIASTSNFCYNTINCISPSSFRVNKIAKLLNSFKRLNI